MFTYITVTLIGIFLLGFQDQYKIKGFDIRYIFCFFESVLMILTVRNPDYEIYKTAFYYKDGPFFETGINLVSDFLKIFGVNNFSFFLLLINVLILFVFSKWGQYIKNINHVIILYSLFIMYYDCIQIRNTIASFIIIFALYVGINGKRAIAIFLCFISLLFHRFSLLTGSILIYTLFIKPNKTYKIKKWEIYILLSIGIMASIFGNVIISLVLNEIPFLGRISFYLTNKVKFDSFIIWGGSATFLTIILWFFGVRYILNSPYRNQIPIERRKVVNILFRYSLFSLFCAGILLYLDEVNRLYRLFYLIQFFLYGTIELYIPRKNRVIIVSSFIFIHVVFMGVAMSRGLNFDIYW